MLKETETEETIRFVVIVVIIGSISIGVRGPIDLPVATLVCEGNNALSGTESFLFASNEKEHLYYSCKQAHCTVTYSYT